jgi:hypothetical protein
MAAANRWHSRIWSTSVSFVAKQAEEYSMFASGCRVCRNRNPSIGFLEQSSHVNW